MSYVGFIKTLCQDYLTGYKEPKVLEIGIHKGQTALPLIHNLSLFEGFTYMGVDIHVRSLVLEQLAQFGYVSLVNYDERSGRDVFLLEANSLHWLEEHQNLDSKFDLVLIDGDHNYKTVSKELELVQSVIHPRSLIVCDDYNGQWAEKDLYYSDRDDYKENKRATPSEESEIQGVRSAIDEFVEAHDNWSICTLGSFDPAFLYRNDVWDRFEFGTDSPVGEKRLNLARNLRLGLKLKNMR